MTSNSEQEVTIVEPRANPRGALGNEAWVSLQSVTNYLSPQRVADMLVEVIESLDDHGQLDVHDPDDLRDTIMELVTGQVSESTYTVWAQIERHGHDRDEPKNVSEPEPVAVFLTAREARDYIATINVDEDPHARVAAIGGDDK